MKRQKPALTILDAMQDPLIFGKHWFQDKTWNAWRVFLRALFGLPMEKHSMEVYRKHTGRKSAPRHASKETWLVVGRRGGKSLISALVAVLDRKSTRLNSSHSRASRMPSSA